MDVASSLDRLRAEANGCSIVAFADLATSMVLSVSSSGRHAQEELDALTQTAVAVLSGGVSESVQAILSNSEPTTAVSMTPVDAKIYVRSNASPNEVLICVCAPDADLSNIVGKSQAVLEDIANGAV